MYVMFSEHLPRTVTSCEKFYLDSKKIDSIEEFYTKFIDEHLHEFPINKEYSKAIHDFLQKDFTGITAIKGHITGPVSFGLHVSDENGKPILYNELLMDIIVKTLIGIIRWQENKLAEICKQTLLFIDEPYMSLIGSTIVAIDQSIMQKWINQLVAVSNGKIGLHCCANTDWALILETNIQIISFDAYEYANSFLLYRKEIAKFLKKGGIIAWGIVPTSPEQVANETIGSLFSKFNLLLHNLETSSQIPRERILQASILTPACGLGLRDEKTTTKVFQLTRDLSEKIRDYYSLR